MPHAALLVCNSDQFSHKHSPFISGGNYISFGPLFNVSHETFYKFSETKNVSLETAAEKNSWYVSRETAAGLFFQGLTWNIRDRDRPPFAGKAGPAAGKMVSRGTTVAPGLSPGACPYPQCSAPGGRPCLSRSLWRRPLLSPGKSIFLGVTKSPAIPSPARSPASITVGMPMETTGVPQGLPAQLLPVVAHPGAGGDAGGGDLDAAAEPVQVRPGQGVYDNHQSGLYLGAQELYLDCALNAGAAQHPGAAEGQGGKAFEAWGCPPLSGAGSPGCARRRDCPGRRG